MTIHKKKKRPLDDLDRDLLSHLRADPLESAKSLAEKLSIGEITVASRIRAMENDGIMKIMAQEDFRSAGYEVLANVEVSIVGRTTEQVAEDFADIPNIGVIVVCIGVSTLSLVVMASSLSELQTLISEKIATVKGVNALETTVFSEIIKYQSEFAFL